jgi:DNA-binding transcriptional LysR family regulator
MSMDWDKLKVFHAAAQAGSFTHAGEQLGLSQSAVSRQVSALEQELGVSLFHRHARGLILTEQRRATSPHRPRCVHEARSRAR